MRAGWLVVAVLPLAAACDPTYCANLHVEVVTAAGAPAPAGTMVYVIDDFPGAPPDLARDTVAAVALSRSGVAGPVRVCRFLEGRASVSIESLGGLLVLRNLVLEFPDAPDYPMRLVAGDTAQHDFLRRR